MGWDAHSSAKVDWDRHRLADDNIHNLFAEAVDEVRKKADMVDGFLHLGSLDLRACAYMLQKATGQSCFSEQGWDADLVKLLNQRANWNFAYEKEESCEYWSARLFLETCAKANLSISFSW